MEIKEIETKVVEVMTKEAKPLRPGDIAKTLGIDSKDISKAIKKLKEKDIIYSPKRCFYSVNEKK